MRQRTARPLVRGDRLGRALGTATHDPPEGEAHPAALIGQVDVNPFGASRVVAAANPGPHLRGARREDLHLLDGEDQPDVVLPVLGSGKQPHALHRRIHQRRMQREAVHGAYHHVRQLQLREHRPFGLVHRDATLKRRTVVDAALAVLRVEAFGTRRGASEISANRGQVEHPLRRYGTDAGNQVHQSETGDTVARIRAVAGGWSAATFRLTGWRCGCWSAIRAAGAARRFWRCGRTPAGRLALSGAFTPAVGSRPIRCGSRRPRPRAITRSRPQRGGGSRSRSAAPHPPRSSGGTGAIRRHITSTIAEGAITQSTGAHDRPGSW